jgi:hypothetical protein
VPIPYPAKNQFLSHFSITAIFCVIDDKHIAIYKRTALPLWGDFVAAKSFPNSVLSPWRFTLQELYQIKVKINLLRIRNID